MEEAVRGGDKTVTVPEIIAAEAKGEPYTGSPFPIDVYYLGNMIRQDFIRRCYGFEFMKPLVDDMVADDPVKRSTVAQVVARLDPILEGLSDIKLRSRVARVWQDSNIFVFVRTISDWRVQFTLRSAFGVLAAAVAAKRTSCKMSGYSQVITDHAMILLLHVLLPLFAATATSSHDPSPTAACADLTAVTSVPNVSVMKSTHFNTGQFNLSSGALSPAVNTLPFCRLVGFYNHTGLANETGSIGFELWLPDAAVWNSRFLGVGGGGFVGSVDVSGFGAPLNQGFAVAGTDSGHQFNASFSSGPGVFIAYQHSQLGLTDWIHDSNHYTAVASKALIGGGQALALAELWPEDFDGIHAGCPGSYYSGLMMALTWSARALKTGNNGSDPSEFPQSALALLFAGALAACDGLDGLADGLIAAPLACAFDPATLACPASGPPSASCLTAPQLATARAFYGGAVDPVTRAQIYPGAGYTQYATAIFENTWAGNLSYDPLADFDFHADLQRVHDGLGVFIDANSPDLRRFHARGGKLLLSQARTYISLADTINPQKYPLDYYSRVQATLGADVRPWFRLFHVPGAYHCGGGPGPNFFDPIPQLVAWVEAGAAPDRIVARKFNDDAFAGGLNRSMPLCPWPQSAAYVGGDVDVESSFVCRELRCV
ncbi:tannase and feruloyl esterase-domain-containing protein [Mycena vulgaris]|nr:tannase and feruloyl esterase-domain-containing protein [Mycena vulgaris]